jgi:hypothetical protein
VITLGVQTSRGDGKTTKHILAIRKLLAEYCGNAYSPEIDEFALIMRIGGEMQEFDFEGCDRIRRNRKERYITVDLGFPSARWKGAKDSSIRCYIAEAVETGLRCFISRLEKDETKINSSQMMSDFARVKEIFLQDTT